MRLGRRARSAPANLSRSILGTAVSNLAVPGAAIITGPILARTLGPTGRGALASVLAPTYLATALFTVGAPSALTYFVAKSGIDLNRSVRLSAVIGGVTGLCAAVVLWTIAPALLRHEAAYVPLLRWSSLLMIPAGIASMLRGVHQGAGDFSRLNAERWFGSVTRLILITVFAMVGILTVASATWASVLTLFVASFLLAGGVVTQSRHRSKNVSANQVTTRAFVRYAGLVAIGAISGNVIIRLDQALMPALSSVRELGYYAVAVSVAELPIFLSIAVRDVVLTVSTQRGSAELVADAARLVLVLQLVVAFVLAPAMPWLVPLAFGGRFTSSVPAVEILLLGGALGAPGSVLNNGLLGQNAPALRAAAQAGAAGVTILALVLLVPPLGAIGAAAASLIAYAFSSLANGILLARLGKLPVQRCLVPRREDLAALVFRVRQSLERRKRPAPEVPA